MSQKFKYLGMTVSNENLIAHHVAEWLCHVQPHNSVSTVMALYAPFLFVSHFAFHDV
jgi:hypothetical protein